MIHDGSHRKNSSILLCNIFNICLCTLDIDKMERKKDSTEHELSCPCPKACSWDHISHNIWGIYRSWNTQGVELHRFLKNDSQKKFASSMKGVAPHHPQIINHKSINQLINHSPPNQCERTLNQDSFEWINLFIIVRTTDYNFVSSRLIFCKRWIVRDICHSHWLMRTLIGHPPTQRFRIK